MTSLVFDNVYDEYEYYTQTFQKEYGKRTIILYQCGGFFEIYSIDDGLVPTKELSDILDVEVSRRNKSIPEVSRQNCMMMGWPIHALSKFVEILIDQHFTVVIVEQLDVLSPPHILSQKTVLKGKNRMERAVTQIMSQGTYMDHMSLEQLQIGKYVMCIYVEQMKQKTKVDEIVLPLENKPVYAFGVSIIDASTGENMFFEIQPRHGDPSFVFDELVRLRVLYPPCELIFVSQGSTHSLTSKEICQHMNINTGTSQSHVCQIIDKMEQLKPEQTKIHHHNYIIGRIFTKCGILSPIEFVDLERLYCARISYVYLLEHITKHNEILLMKIDKPFSFHSAYSSSASTCSQSDISIDENNNNRNIYTNPHLILSANTAEQLDIPNSLLRTLNTCISLMGKRYFRYRLLNPRNDISFLKKSYHKIDLLLKYGPECIENIRQKLKNVFDLERLFRKIVIGSASCPDLLNVYRSLHVLQEMVNYLDKKEEIPKYNWMSLQNTTKCAEMDTFMSSNLYLNDIQDTENYTEKELKYMQTLNIPIYFHKKTYENKEILNNIVKKREDLDTLCELLNGLIESKSKELVKHFKLEKTDRDGFYITCTTKRYNDAKKELQKFTTDKLSSPFDFKDAQIKTQTNTVKIQHKFLENMSKTLQDLKEEWQRETQKTLLKMLKSLTERFFMIFRPLCTCLSEIDFHSTCAFHAFYKKYCAPYIVENSKNTDNDFDEKVDKSFLRCKDLRHPIVEVLDASVPFIGNDVSLGESDKETGMLLYGLNAAGKSTLMKSIAIAIIMAQAGMYVPASEFSFYPYKSLFSRITRGDDIQRGQSTFMIEMQELRNILKRSDQNSLIIGDELCSGTESASALGIVAAGLHTLCHENKATFIFTTHLHDLTKISKIEDLYNNKQLAICHLHVEYDQVTHKLIYDRKLKNGQGLSIYGLEVCKALDLGPCFIELANEIRQEVLSQERDTSFYKKTRYNGKFYVDQCSICKKKAQEVHHIFFQKDADEHGFIDRLHKDKLYNLMNVCESCHDAIHREDIVVKGYIKTSEGIELQIEKNEKNLENLENLEKKNDRVPRKIIKVKK